MTALEFRTAHERAWAELEALLAKPLREIDPARFGVLYRQSCEQLALAQAREYPPHLIERLSTLTAHAHQVLYRRGDYGIKRVLAVLAVEFPARVRIERAYVLAAALLFLVPTLVTGVLTFQSPDFVYHVVDPATVAQFDSMYSDTARSIGRTRDAATDLGMFGFYILNNIGLAFQCYASGLLFGLGSIFFLIFNGLYSGSIAGFVTAHGHGPTFYSFIVTHSAFELTAIVLSGAAGLKLGQALLLPGRHTRVAALQEAGRDSAVIIFGAAVMLLIAAALEAFWSSAVWVSHGAKYLFAASCWLLVLTFFVRRSRAG